MSEKQISRRELLKQAGAVGAGAVVAGSLTGKAGAAVGKAAVHSATPKKGGKITWALEQDPGHIAPYGAILTITRTAQEPMYESLLSGTRPQPQACDRVELRRHQDAKTIDFNIRPGIKFSNGQPVTADDIKYSFDLQLAPPLPGSVSVLGQVPSIAGIEVLSARTRPACT